MSSTETKIRSSSPSSVAADPQLVELTHAVSNLASCSLEPERDADSVLWDEEPGPSGIKGDLSDLFDYVAEDSSELSPDWLTKLQLQRPRRGLRCLSTRTRRVKRAMDIVGALTLLVLLTPAMILTAIAVAVTSRGPIIYSQRRVGINQRMKRRDRRNPLQPAIPPADTGERRHPENQRRRSVAYGKPFVLHKFRTMRTDAEKAGAQFATKGDNRVTPVGRFLRKSRLDELPQLWNVLKGEMSLVGPRPERPEFVEKLSIEIPNYLNRLGLKPGLTGLAQVVNGYDNEIESFRRKVKYDLIYLQNCCIRNDLKILFRTIGVVLTGKGAL